MRFTLPLAVAALLTACASMPASPSTSLSTAPATTAAPSRIGQLLAAAGQQNAPTRAEIERVLGAPDIARADGAGAALTYRLESCALLLLFAADNHNAMRLSEAHPSARRAGAAVPSMEQCAAEASARG